MNHLIRIVAAFCLTSLAACGKQEPFTLSGIFVPVFTPMDEEGNLNLTKIPAYAKYLKECGIDGVVLTSILGEGPNLCVREKKSVYDTWMMFAGQLGLKVVLQIGGGSLPDVKELAQYANVLNVDAILVLPTVYYTNLTVEELTCVMKEISECAPSIPFLYYDFPEWSHVHVDMVDFFRSALDYIPQFKGVVTDFTTNLEILAGNKLPKQRLFIRGYLLPTAAVANEYNTFFVAFANIAPELYLKMFRKVHDGDYKEATELLLTLIELRQDIIARFDPMTAMKLATELVSGVLLGNPRLPLPPVEKKDREYIISVLKKYDLRIA